MAKGLFKQHAGGAQVSTNGNGRRLLRRRIIVRGAVQGVGFRPFVYRLARSLKLTGWVQNTPHGVIIEVETTSGDSLLDFTHRLRSELPPRAAIHSLETTTLDAVGYDDFTIRDSLSEGTATALVMPDIATCSDCRREIFNPRNRRFYYPFTNCTNCGPRFSIILALPYDRNHTTMRDFIMCPACHSEYVNPLDRRFHAQPNACPLCGPQVEFWAPDGFVLATRQEALFAAIQALRDGRIVAVKGLGGFHLMVDARRDDAVRELRRRKHRDQKPFALMAPSLDAARRWCAISPEEEALLTAPEAPIVLLRRRHGSTVNAEIAPSVAPDNPWLGVMLPYSPLHHIILAELGFPLVATSGNLSDEPICTDEREAVERLSPLADFLLVHNRPIARPIDDSVARVVLGRELILRRSRGYAPLPLPLPESVPATLGVGGHLKNTVALGTGRQVILSQHIGDLETEASELVFRQSINSLESLYGQEPQRLACDLHPSYLSTQFAKTQEKPVISVQHHFAHILACMAENEIRPPVLGVAWDGTGWGPDGTIWGGEFIGVTDTEWQRSGHLRTFSLPGGEAAMRDPRRSAFGVLFEIGIIGHNFDSDLGTRLQISPREWTSWSAMLQKGLNSPRTSSAGRLFDAAAAITGLCHQIGFEGQAAMTLECAIGDTSTRSCYPFSIGSNPPVVLDWEPTLRAVLDDVRSGVSTDQIAARFHNTMSEMIVAACRALKAQRVALGGGCFQNARLLEHTVRRLKEEGLAVYWPQRVPPNDGGLALGQILAAGRADGAARPHPIEMCVSTSSRGDTC